MKSLPRITLGLASSLCLAAGLTRTAERLDPMSSRLSSPKGKVLDRTAMCCVTLPCFVPERSNS